jgi:hypothetical protein
MSPEKANKPDWSRYIGYFMFIAAVIGWAYDSGQKSARIEVLETRFCAVEDDNKYLIEFNREQIEINASIKDILVEFRRSNRDDD